MNKQQDLAFTSVGHAAWSTKLSKASLNHPLGLYALRYFRFHRMAEIRRIDIYPVNLRHQPYVKGEPSHIIAQAYSQETEKWTLASDTKLPYFDNEKMHSILLPSIKTNCIRLICTREHAVAPSHGEQWQRREIVPFGILDNVKFKGSFITDREEPVYNPPLIKKTIKTLDEYKGMKIINEPHQVKYTGRYFSVGFSLRRPLIVFLGWDNFGINSESPNLIPDESVWQTENSFCGPVLMTAKGDIPAIFHSGEVCVKGMRVIYKNLKAIEGLSTDVAFDINEYGMDIHITKTCEKELYAIEADDWRFVWDAKKSITGTLGLPSDEPGRTGLVELPAMWNAPGMGTVSVEMISSNSSLYLQADSWRKQGLTWAGIALGFERDKLGYMTLKPGRYAAHLRISTKPVLPKHDLISAKDIPLGILRNWSTGLTFRPELCGFSNNSISVNCHLAQFHVADLIYHTKTDDHNHLLTDLLRYTIELGLKGGSGYGDIKELYLDSDPSLLISAWRGAQLSSSRNIDWPGSIYPFFKQACIRVMNGIDESGLLKSKFLSGNSGSKKWSTNGWDVVSFGNYDAYSNALCYRALRNAASFSAMCKDKKFSEECTAYADKLKKAYYTCFHNTRTGLISGWRSNDGKLHDYAFTFINYMAICYGLVDDTVAVSIIDKLEKMMIDAGLDYFYYGIPANLVSIKNEDAPYGNDFKRKDGLDKYGIYLNGSLSTIWMDHYIRALDMYRYKDKSDLVCAHLTKSFSENRTIGGFNTGKELFTWEGRPCGYEGIGVTLYPVLTAMASHLGIIDNAKDEWWL